MPVTLPHEPSTVAVRAMIGKLVAEDIDRLSRVVQAAGIKVD